MSVDPLAANFANLSPYNYVMGNPIILVDPDGRNPVYIDGIRASEAEEAAVNKGTYHSPKTEDYYIFVEIFFRKTITKLGAGITYSGSLGVVAAINGDGRGSFKGFRPYISGSFGAAFGSNGFRVGIGTGLGHGDFDSFGGLGANFGFNTTITKYLPKSFNKFAGGEASIPFPLDGLQLDEDRNALGGGSGLFAPPQFKGVDIGIGTFGYVDASLTGYLTKNPLTFSEMLGWLEKQKTVDPSPTNIIPMGWGDRFIKQLSDEVIKMNSKINDYLVFY